MSTKIKRAALYTRVSTDRQTVENQVSELRQVAARRSWEIVEIYRDAGISGAKGRDQRPGLDAMLNDAGRRRFDVVMAWADRSAWAVADRPSRHHPASRGGRCGSLSGATAPRHDHARWQAALPDHRSLWRIRALDDPSARQAGLAPIKARIARGEVHQQGGHRPPQSRSPRC